MQYKEPIKFALMLCLCLCSIFAAAQGILSPQPIGQFLNGNLPNQTPDGEVGSPIAPALLSQTGAFSDLINLIPSSGVIPYDMVEPFWSDGAQKSRWMAIPNDGTHDTAGEKIIFSDTEPWIFPTGAVMIKHFELGGSRLETRFEVMGNDGEYYYLTYKWNAAQTDADLLTSFITESVSVNGVNQTWYYLTPDQCVDCHTSFAGKVLGPKTRQLNRAITYPSTGISSNQLVTLSHLGIIDEQITDSNTSNYFALAAKDDLNFSLEDRARSYVDVNCSSCHQPGSDNVALFDARFTTPLADQNIINGAVTYDEGLIDPSVVIPMDVNHSMMHFRMNSLATGVAMPPIAKDVVDTLGVQLIEDWINSLQPVVNNTPTAIAEASSSFGFVPMSVQFNASNSSDPNNLTLTYAWDFGDGNTATGVSPSHTYTIENEYTVLLTVSNGTEIDQTALNISANNGNPGENTVAFNINALLLFGSNNSGVAIAVADMNGDNRDDIIRLNSADILDIQYQTAPNQAFNHHNHGSVGSSNQWGMCIADYDHNGYNDIMTGGAYDGLKIYTNNNGFDSYTQTSLADGTIFLQGANFHDIDNDGWADIFACHDDAESRPYKNNTDGTFTWTASLIETETVPSSDNSGNYASIWTDYNNDGFMDLYISKCRGGASSSTDPRRINMLFESDGNGGFTEVADQAGLKIGAQTWLTDFGDIDNDGDMDAIVINHSVDCQLMINNGDGTFTDSTANSGLLPNLSPSNYYGIQALFRDFNNDGFVDLIATGGDHHLFYNNGDGTFTPAPNPFNTNDIQSLAVGDLNSDGFLDIYAGYAGGLNSPSSIPDQLWINEGNTNNYTAITLKGVQSNINGIGSRIELYGSWGVQIREVRSGEGYGIMNSLNTYFGIGNSTEITKIVVRWPSGLVQEVLNPAINQFLLIEEGSNCEADADSDGVCDSLDICPNFNDNLIGNSCEDGDICTTGETYDSNCNCTGGTFADADNDGVCDAEDACPNVNDNLIGTACDDGIACSAGSIYDANCNCSGGIISDADGDGVCTNDDIDDTNPCVPNECPVCENVSLIINFDNYPEETSWTILDTVGNIIIGGGTYPDAPDGSTDTFTNCLEIDCYSLEFYDSFGDGICCGYGNGSFALVDAVGDTIGSGAEFTNTLVIDFCVGSTCNTIGQTCDDGLACTIGETYDVNCNCNGGTFTDADSDGVCDSEDVCPNFDDNLIGTTCDDGDICTTGETYNANCECAGGTFADADNDGICDAEDVCPNLNDNLIGTTCDDGLACTTGETYNSNCECAGGTFVDTDNDGVCDAEDICPNFDDALIGTICEDGDICTTGETYNSNCECTGGTFADSDNDGVCDAEDVCPKVDDNIIGTTCDDGNACTVGETYDANCNCSGGVFADADNDGVCDAEDVCPNLNDNLIGTTCDDGNACTVGETYDANCNCSGGVFADADNDGVCTNDDIDDNDPCVPNACSTCEDISLIINFDDYPEETSWAIFDSLETIVASGGTYPDAPDASTDTFTNCLNPGCYELEFYDAYGDGICCAYGIGLFALTNAVGDTLGTGAEFGDTLTISFCVATQQCNIGESCDDGNECTTGETYDTNCNCTGGTISDYDSDGICDNLEYCSDFDVINNNSIINYNIDVINYIENNGLIDANTTVEFAAGNYIELTTGFEANTSSNFAAKIENCNE